MRSRGAVASPHGLGAGDHVCWTYASGQEWRDAAAAWLEDGRRMGLKLLVTADRPAEELVADLAALPGRDALLASGQLVAVPLRALYPLDAAIDPAAQLLVYQGALQAALDEGYRGLRAVADGTPLAADPFRRASLERWEVHADRWLASGVPVSCLCTLDARRLDPLALQEVLRLHPCVHHDRDDVPFHVSGGDGALAVDGEIDRAEAATFARVLALGPELSGQTVDLSRLAFADRHAVLALGRAVAAADAPVTLHGAAAELRRAWGLLDLPAEPRVRWT